MKTTRRKTKVVGVQEYINRDTGEIISCRVVRIEEKDANFRKIWIAHLLDAVEEIGSKKLRVLMWLFDKADAYNRIVATAQEIANQTKISLNTVKRTLVALEQKDIIKRRIGIVTLNPEVIFKGGTSERMNVLIEYKSIAQSSHGDIETEQPKSNIYEKKTA
ncbi:MAG: replication/maintenance protein RepL [Thaumarchaeota archaeon]|nr:replication/maintenance protein RepL [Nitrososphaerota archaeon]